MTTTFCSGGLVAIHRGSLQRNSKEVKAGVRVFLLKIHVEWQLANVLATYAVSERCHLGPKA